MIKKVVKLKLLIKDEVLNNSIKFLYTLIISFTIFSCKEKNQDSEEVSRKIERNNSSVYINLKFPDTVLVNNSYSGEIQFNNALDTITSDLNDLKKHRFIKYLFTGTTTINYDVQHLKTIIKDTAWAISNKVIPIKDIWFGKTGVYFFDGIIVDEVIIKDATKDKDGKSMARIITDEFRLSKKVVVLEKR